MPEVRTKPRVRSRFPAFIREVRATWLTIADIADEYGLERAYVRQLMEGRKIEVFKLDGLYHVNPTSLDGYLESIHKVPLE